MQQKPTECLHSDLNAVPAAPQTETNNAHPAVVVALPAEVFLKSFFLFSELFLFIQEPHFVRGFVSFCSYFAPAFVAVSTCLCIAY